MMRPVSWSTHGLPWGGTAAHHPHVTAAWGCMLRTATSLRKMASMATALTKKENAEQLLRNEVKWTKPLMDAGWTVVPSVIFERQDALGLDAVDINLIMHLAMHWWYSENLPRPSKGRLAKCMNVSESTVRRHMKKLEELHFIERVPRHNAKNGGQGANFYSLSGLIKEATPFALEIVQERRMKQAETAARQNRKKPKLELVGGTDADVD